MHVDILGKRYEVSILSEMLTAGNMGNANRSMQQITIGDFVAPEQREDTLLHEILHVIDGELKVGLTEDDVARLAVGLYSAGYRHPLFNDNVKSAIPED